MLGISWSNLFVKSDPFRKHPIILPETVVREPHWPSIDQAAIIEYWDNLKNRNSPLAEISPDKTHIPLWIWGDECQFRENGDELLVICIGSILDPRKFSIDCCYPLALCRSEACLVLVLANFEKFPNFWNFSYAFGSMLGKWFVFAGDCQI